MGLHCEGARSTLCVSRAVHITPLEWQELFMGSLHKSSLVQLQDTYYSEGHIFHASLWCLLLLFYLGYHDYTVPYTISPSSLLFTFNLWSSNPPVTDMAMWYKERSQIYIQWAQNHALMGPPSLLHCWVTLVTQPCHLCGCIRFLSISDWMAYFCISLLSSFLCFSDLSPYKQDTVRFCFLFKSSLSFAAFCSVVISIISTIFGVTTIVLQFISSYSHVLCIPSPLLKYSLLYFILYVCERNKGNRKPSLWHCNNNGYSQDVLIKAKINGQNLKGKRDTCTAQNIKLCGGLKWITDIYLLSERQSWPALSWSMRLVSMTGFQQTENEGRNKWPCVGDSGQVPLTHVNKLNSVTRHPGYLVPW